MRDQSIYSTSKDIIDGYNDEQLRYFTDYIGVMIGNYI